MREYILINLDGDLLVETLPNSVFNYLVSHVVPRADNGDVGVLSAVQAQLEHGITRLVQELEWWMADGASQLRYQSRTDNVQVAVLVAEI